MEHVAWFMFIYIVSSYLVRKPSVPFVTSLLAPLPISTALIISYICPQKWQFCSDTLSSGIDVPAILVLGKYAPCFFLCQMKMVCALLLVLYYFTAEGINFYLTSASTVSLWSKKVGKHSYFKAFFKVLWGFAFAHA